MKQPEAGWLHAHGKNVVWEMSASDARELADFFDLTPGPDKVHEDARALREWADYVDPPKDEVTGTMTNSGWVSRP